MKILFSDRGPCSLNKNLVLVDESITITTRIVSWCITNDVLLDRLLNPHNYFSNENEIELDGIMVGVYEDCLSISNEILCVTFEES